MSDVPCQRVHGWFETASTHRQVLDWGPWHLGSSATSQFWSKDP